MYVSRLFADSSSVSFLEMLSKGDANLVLSVQEKISYLQPKMLGKQDAKEVVNEHKVLYFNDKYLFYNEKTPNNLTLYDIPNYRVDLIDNAKLANIFPADSSDFFDVSLYNIVALSVNPHCIVSSICNQVKNKNGSINVADSCMTLSYGNYTYVIFLDKKRINQVDIIKNSNGELFMRAMLVYGNGILPISATVDYFYKNEIAIQKTYSFLLKSENIPDDAAKCFDIKAVGIYKFVDMRFDPAKNYSYENGIPTLKEANHIENIMKIQDVSSILVNERNNKLNTGIQSKLLLNVQKFLKEQFSTEIK